MGINLIPIVRNFAINVRAARPCEVQEACLSAGNHRLLSFDFLCWNAGNQDAYIGDPASYPGWFEYGACHGHDHLKDFNQYQLFGPNRQLFRGKKEAFCLMDSVKIDTWAGA
jgi:hypothetical protein